MLAVKIRKNKSSLIEVDLRVNWMKFINKEAFLVLRVKKNQIRNNIYLYIIFINTKKLFLIVKNLINLLILFQENLILEKKIKIIRNI